VSIKTPLVERVTALPRTRFGCQQASLLIYLSHSKQKWVGCKRLVTYCLWLDLRELYFTGRRFHHPGSIDQHLDLTKSRLWFVLVFRPQRRSLSQAASAVRLRRDSTLCLEHWLIGATKHLFRKVLLERRISRNVVPRMGSSHGFFA
jgi:hypothetical protein